MTVSTRPITAKTKVHASCEFLAHDETDTEHQVHEVDAVQPATAERAERVDSVANQQTE